MLLNPSIRCVCGGTDLTAVPLRRADGTAGIAALTCTYCGLTWDAVEVPGCPGPNYEQTYSGDPDLIDQELALLLLAEDLKARSTAALTGRGPTVDRDEHRDFLLGKAAFLDRVARQVELGYFTGEFDAETVTDASTKAVLAAGQLLRVDLRHAGSSTLGPVSANSPDWDGVGGTRAYVRQEYLALRQAEESETDQAKYPPQQDHAGELFDAEGRPL